MDTTNNNQSTLDFSKIITEEQASVFFEDLGLTNLPTERKQDMLEKMVDTVMSRAFLRMDEMLNAEQRQKIQELDQRQASNEEYVQFISTSLPSAPNIIQEEIVNYQQQLKSDLRALVENLDNAEESDLNNIPTTLGASDQNQENIQTQNPQLQSYAIDTPTASVSNIDSNNNSMLNPENSILTTDHNINVTPNPTITTHELGSNNNPQ